MQAPAGETENDFASTHDGKGRVGWDGKLVALCKSGGLLMLPSRPSQQHCRPKLEDKGLCVLGNPAGRQ
jgi:hypothetical protein